MKMKAFSLVRYDKQVIQMHIKLHSQKFKRVSFTNKQLYIFISFCCVMSKFNEKNCPFFVPDFIDLLC